jgi:hypothetical protein
LPTAFQRIPPKSQYDCSKPHFRHFINHRRESASIDFAHSAGKIDVKNFCIQLMIQPFRLPVKGEPPAAQISNIIRGITRRACN